MNTFEDYKPPVEFVFSDAETRDQNLVPASIEAEQTALGILLVNPEKFGEAELGEEMFFRSYHRKIFQNIRGLVAKGVEVDAITVADAMKKPGDNEPHLQNLISLVDSIAGSANFKTYCGMIREKYRKRSALAIANQLARNIEDENVIQESIAKLMQLDFTGINYEYDLASALKIGLDAIKKRSESENSLTGIDTGITGLNEALGGFNAGDFVLVGARPGMGKTAFLLNAILRAKAPVGLISSEQGICQIVQRMLSIEGYLPMQKLRTGKLLSKDWEYLAQAAKRIKNHPGVWTYDRSGASIEEVESVTRRWKYEHGIQCVFIDYLQRLRVPRGSSKSDTVAENCFRLKNLGNDLQIPVVSAAQVKREVENRPDKRPGLSDFSDSKETDAEADVAMFLYRDEYYNKDSAFPGVMEINIEKNRHGPTTTVHTKFTPQFLRISDMCEGNA